VLDHGDVLQIGNAAEIRESGDERIQGLINRRPRHETLDADEYLRRLTE